MPAVIPKKKRAPDPARSVIALMVFLLVAIFAGVTNYHLVSDLLTAVYSTFGIFYALTLSAKDEIVQDFSLGKG